MPAIMTRLRRAWRGFLDLPPLPEADTGQAIAILERARLISPGEAHALCAGENLADLYADIARGEGLTEAEALEEIEALIRLGSLSEAIVQLGRLHPALRDLPHLYNRSPARARA